MQALGPSQRYTQRQQPPLSHLQHSRRCCQSLSLLPQDHRGPWLYKYRQPRQCSGSARPRAWCPAAGSCAAEAVLKNVGARCSSHACSLPPLRDQVRSSSSSLFTPVAVALAPPSLASTASAPTAAWAPPPSSRLIASSRFVCQGSSFLIESN